LSHHFFASASTTIAVFSFSLTCIRRSGRSSSNFFVLEAIEASMRSNPVRPFQNVAELIPNSRHKLGTEIRDPAL
jgi:hypothetical protein